jgi:hypothetical protein
MQATWTLPLHSSTLFALPFLLPNTLVVPSLFGVFDAIKLTVILIPFSLAQLDDVELCLQFNALLSTIN